MTKNVLMAFALSVLALGLVACSSDSDKAALANPNVYPTNYKGTIVATLRELFKKNQTAWVSGALISPPVLSQVGKDQLYTLCVHYTAHGGSGYVGISTRRGYFYAGHLNQLVPVSDDQCAGVAYQPFKELNRLCAGDACAKSQKSKSGWGLF
jgi:hypothetical protein